jgi:hypothetical protein
MFYGHMCLSGNSQAVEHVKEAGIDESHLMCCIAADGDYLFIHEKIK